MKDVVVVIDPGFYFLLDKKIKIEKKKIGKNKNKD